MPFDPSQPFEEVSGFDPSKPFQEVGTAVAEPPAVSLEEPESAQSINRFFAQAAVDRQDTPNMAGMKGAWESLVHPQIQIPKFPDQPTETLPEAPPQSPAQLSVGGGFSFPTTQRKADPVTAGLYNAAAGLAEFFTSPIGIATAGLSSLPASVGKVAGAAFAVDLSRSLPELAQGLSEAVKSGNTQKAVELGASGVVQLAAIKGGVKHAVGEGIPVRAPKPEIIPEQPFSTNEGQQPIQISGEDRLSQIEKELGPRDEPIIEDGKVTGQRPVRGITTEERNLLEQRANEPVTEPAVTLGEIPPSSGTAPPEVRPVEIEEAAPDATKESLPVAESPVGGSAEPVTPEAAPQVPQAEVTPENPVVGFTTAKGSEYTIDESGNTTRLKKSAGLRQGEVHEKLPVVFVTPEVQDAIMQSGQSGERIILGERASDGTWKQIRPEVNTDLRGRTLAIYTLDRTTGTTTGSHVVSTTPAVGSHPFEIGYERDKKTFHMGNKIVELKYPEPVRAENAQGEPTPPITESAPVETAASDAPNKGMGGAIPSEFQTSNQTPTGIKNATVEVERAKRGLPPAIEPARRSFGRVWDEAMAIVDRDPKAQDDLIDSLRRKPRALTDTEDALLLQRQIDLQNEYGKATRDLAQAFDDGRSEAVVEEKLRVARISDQLLDLYNVGKKSGTETGRGLNARKMMANEDFTLAQMEISKRAANEGRPLSDAERAELEVAHQRIVETDKAFEDYKAKAQERIVNLELAKAAAEAKRQPTVNPYILSVAEKIVGRLDTAADAARERIKKRGFNFNTGIDPTVLLDVAQIGAAQIGHIGLDLAKWSIKMAEEFGEGIKPHLPEIWKASQGVIEGLKVDQKVKRAVKKQDVTEKISSDVAKIKEQFAKSGKEDLSTQVNLLARHLIESGIKDREKLIDAIHERLKEADPEITRREAMDALSGYGDFRQLSKDKISIELRGIKGEMQQIAKLEDMAAGIPPRKTGMERREPTQAERELIKAVNEAKFKFQVPMTDPATQLKSALDTRKIQLRNRETDLRKKLADKEFLPKERRELKLDAEAIRLEANAKRAKEDFQRGLVLDRLSKRTLWEKFQDTFVKWRRGFLLSSPVTIAKLFSAALQRMAITPTEELVGTGISKIIPKVSAKAQREGVGSIKAEAAALTEGFTKGMADAWKTARTGRSDLDALYGKADLIPKSAIDFFGQLHSAMKAPTKRNEFARSFQKRVEASLRDGIDPSDPMVQMKIAAEAYKDANRAIFQQDNAVVSAYKAALSTLNRVDKTTGKVPAGKKALATAMQVALPIVKVPTNIVAETLQYSVGSITGSVRLANALRKGVDTLKPEEADLIMRQLKKGSLGAAVLLIGFLNPETIGGYYQQGDNKKKGLVKAGHARIYGVDIPSFLLHNPLLETAQIGATMRRVMDSKLKKSDTETQGIGAGIWAGALGLADEVPFVREMLEFTKIWNPRERGAFTGELIKSTVVPQALQWAARQGDKNAQGDVTVRKPTTVLEHIKTGIPGLRQQVPAKP